jgi:hypothetical protein
MPYDYEHCDGFDKYGPANRGVGISDLSGDWTAITPLFGGLYNISSLTITNSLQGPGSSLHIQMSGGGSGSGTGVVMTNLPNNYARSLGTYYFLSDLTHPLGVCLMDGLNGQTTIGIASGTGRPTAWRGDPGNNGPIIGSAAVGVVANTIHCLQWDVTIHNTAGIVKIWLDSALVLNLTGQNTRNTGNNFINAYGPAGMTSGGFAGNWYIDHLWTGLYINAGGTDTPPLTNPILETSFPTADSVVQFTPGAGILGSVSSVTANTNAPGANTLALRQYTPVVNATLSSVTIWPTVTNSTVKFKAAIYADASGVPGALIAQGPEIVGCANTALTLPITTPPSITVGTPVWIGYLTDTSITLAENDTTTPGYKATVTYTSGVPGTAPTMTGGQPAWGLYGNLISMAHNWPQEVGNPPAYDSSYNSSGTVGNQDLLTFGPLSGTPSAIYTTAVKAFMKLDNAGAHAADLATHSGTITGNGSTLNWAVGPASYGWVNSFFDNDPNTSAPWASAAALNAATSGYKIAS